MSAPGGSGAAALLDRVADLLGASSEVLRGDDGVSATVSFDGTRAAREGRLEGMIGAIGGGCVDSRTRGSGTRGLRGGAALLIAEAVHLLLHRDFGGPGALEAAHEGAPLLDLVCVRSAGEGDRTQVVRTSFTAAVLTSWLWHNHVYR